MTDATKYTPTTPSSADRDVVLGFINARQLGDAQSGHLLNVDFYPNGKTARLSLNDVPVLVLRLSPDGSVPESVEERMIAADLKAPYCSTCADMDVYDRSPETCHECARIRLRAALTALLPLPETTP